MLAIAVNCPTLTDLPALARLSNHILPTKIKASEYTAARPLPTAVSNAETLLELTHAPEKASTRKMKRG